MKTEEFIVFACVMGSDGRKTEEGVPVRLDYDTLHNGYIHLLENKGTQPVVYTVIMRTTGTGSHTPDIGHLFLRFVDNHSLYITSTNPT
jgi:hypothetical protein